MILFFEVFVSIFWSIQESNSILQKFYRIEVIVIKHMSSLTKSNELIQSLTIDDL